MVQYQGLEELSVLFWKPIFQSKYTSWCQFYKMMCSHCKICVIFNVNLHCVLFQDSSILILLPSVDQLSICLSVSNEVETLNYDQFDSYTLVREVIDSYLNIYPCTSCST